jgi:predicted RNA-binding protein YlxR (DUF448 family)
VKKKRNDVQTETMRETTPDERPPKVGPTRTCAGCGRHDDAEALVRVVLGPPDEKGDSLAVDLAGGSFGRGAHVHAREACLRAAAKGGFARSFKRKVAASAEEVAAQIVEGCDRRIAGLLLGGRRAGHLALGADAASDAIAKGAPCVVVACDAGSVTDKGALGAAVREGRAVAWKTKGELGALMGRDEVAVCAVTHASVAEQIVRARRLADEVSALAGTLRSTDACRSREVR